MLRGIKDLTVWSGLLLACVVVCDVHAQSVAEADTTDGRPRVAVLPFANYTGQGEADDIFQECLYGALGSHRVPYMTAHSLRPLLRQHRIRTQGYIDRRGARIIAEATGARYLVLGSWDMYRKDGNVEVGFSIRVLETNSLALVAAVSVGATGEDEVGWLELGRVTDVEILAETIMDRAVGSLLPFPEPREASLSWWGCNQLAVVPFDNFSDTRHAGGIVTNILLSRLLAEGYFVVEPGFVKELGLVRETVLMGGVDRASARSLEDSYGACRIVTGAVELFEPSRGDPSVSIPRIAIGLRVTSSASGNLYMIRNAHAAGDDKQSVFQFGREHALTALADRVLAAFAKELSESNRKDILHGPVSGSE